MRKVFLLTGFNNWGKSTLIRDLFKKKRFRSDRLHNYAGAEHVYFCVQPQSNDDLSRGRYESEIKKRLTKLQKLGKKPTYIFAAFCPTQEKNNNSRDIIKDLFQNDQVHIIAIKYKWCCHAQLIIPEIKKYYASLTNVTVHVLNEKGDKKRDELVSLLKPLL